MDERWLAHQATADELRQFDEQGYLIVENALDAAMVAKLEAVCDRIDAEERARLGLGPEKLMQKFRTIVEDDLLLELLDCPTTLPKIWSILGWNIQHYISHLIVYPPEPAGAERKTSGAGWHQDGGRPVPEMERPHPRLSLKCSYWLSDTTIPDSGVFRIVPGSHRWDQLPDERDANGDPPGAIDVGVKPGTAVLFDRRLWHTRTYNYSAVTRKVLFIGYSYRWLRGLDYSVMPDEVLAKCDPIRRQLMGDTVTVKGWWQPEEADVPLRTWLREHECEAAKR